MYSLTGFACVGAVHPFSFQLLPDVLMAHAAPTLTSRWCALTKFLKHLVSEQNYCFTVQLHELPSPLGQAQRQAGTFPPDKRLFPPRAEGRQSIA